MKKKVISIIVCLIIMIYPSANLFDLVQGQALEQNGETRSEVLQELATGDVHNAQENIEKTQTILQNDSTPAVENEILKIKNGETTFRKVFRNVCIVGDSLMNGLETFDILNSNNLITQVSASLYHLSDNIGKIVGMSPRILILHYGINMLDSDPNQPGNFVKFYKELINELKAELPETRIIVSGIFPVDTSIVKAVRFERIGEYNAALSAMCGEIGVEFLDNAPPVAQYPECYASDGIHLNKKFYSDYWLIYIMREKEII